MTSTGRIGVRLKPVQASLRRDGHRVGRVHGGPLVADHRPVILTLAILTLAAFARVAPVALMSLKKCLAAREEDVAVPPIADRMSKPNWNCRWKKRIAAECARCKCRWLSPAPHVTAPA